MGCTEGATPPGKAGSRPQGRQSGLQPKLAKVSRKG